MLKCVGSCPEGDRQSWVGELRFPPGTRGVGAVQPWSKPPLQVLFLGQIMLFMLSGTCFPFFITTAAAILADSFSVTQLNKKKPFFSCPAAFITFMVGCSHGHLKTSLLCQVCYWGGKKGRGETCSDPHNTEYCDCRTEDVVVWPYPSFLFSGPAVLPVIHLSVSSLDHSDLLSRAVPAPGTCDADADWEIDLWLREQIWMWFSSSLLVWEIGHHDNQQLSCQGLWLF